MWYVRIIMTYITARFDVLFLQGVTVGHTLSVFDVMMYRISCIHYFPLYVCVFPTHSGGIFARFCL